jgi:hypothetical protein
VLSTFVAGRPAAAGRSAEDRAWRSAVAASAAKLGLLRAVGIDLTVRPGRWVDLDSLLEVVVAGLRDGGAVAPGLRTLDGLVATKREAAPEGAHLTALDPAEVWAAVPPGPTCLRVEADVVPRPGDRTGKRRLRGLVGGQAHGHLAGAVWADVALGVPGSLLTPLEPTLDALEPVLGRDPRGRTGQEFFPNDHLIGWLRVRRTTDPPPLRLSLGTLDARHARGAARAGRGSENG